MQSERDESTIQDGASEAEAEEELVNVISGWVPVGNAKEVPQPNLFTARGTRTVCRARLLQVRGLAGSSGLTGAGYRGLITPTALSHISGVSWRSLTKACSSNETSGASS